MCFFAVCLAFASLVPVSVRGETARTGPFPPEADYGRLLDTLHAAFDFRRLGLVRREGGAASLVRAALESGRRRGYAVTIHDVSFSDADPDACREAVDALFFEGVDALGLDDSACFDPGSRKLADLLEGLRLQGVMALSLHSEEQVRAGALAGPAGMAMHAETAPVEPGSPSPGAEPAADRPPDGPRPTVFAPLAVNLETAGAMGITLSPAALLAAERLYGRTAPDSGLQSISAPGASPPRRSEGNADERIPQP